MKAIFLMLCLVMALLASHAVAQSPRLTLEVLKNSQYRVNDETIKLQDGRFLRKTPDNYLDVTLSKAAFGELNNDDSEDAAVLLSYNGGGSGTFSVLYAVINRNGTPYHAALKPLGDRVIIQSFEINSGRISVEMIAHGPNDPACCPTLRRVIRYRLNANRLMEH